MSFTSSAGWRSVIVEQYLPNVDGPSGGQVSVVGILAPNEPDWTQAQLDAIEAAYSMFGGFASCRIVGRLWWPPPTLTLEQQKALAGVE